MPAQINAQKACLLLPNVSMVLRRFDRTRFNLISTNFSSRSFGVLNGAAIYQPFRTFSSSIDILISRNFPPRTYQVVVAATREMGIGKSRKLPWRLPTDVKFFKELTLATTDSAKKNAVLMGRKTWESIPLLYRPLPGRLNIVLTRSASLDIRASENVVICRSIPSALELLSQPPYSLSMEKVYVIGGGQILSEALNGPRCDAIHVTEIETSIECDTFIPTIDLSIFRPWYSSIPLVENNIRYSFVTYVRRGLTPGSGNSVNSNNLNEFAFLPKLVEEIISSSAENDRAGVGNLSKFGGQRYG